MGYPISRDSTNQEDMKLQTNEGRVKPAGHLHHAEKGKMQAAGETIEISRRKELESRDNAAPDRKLKTKLRQLDAKDVDAVFAEGQGAINSLRDVQVLGARLRGVTVHLPFCVCVL